MYCSNCGNKREKNEKYCINCGASFEKEAETPSNTKGISSILGILSFIFIFLPIISIPLAIISIIVGIKEKREGIKTSIGIIFGIISLLITIIVYSILAVLILNIKKWADNPKENWKNKIEEFYKDNFEDKEDFFHRNQTDDLKGKVWQGNDKSTLYLKEDNTYEWFLDDSQKDDNYYIGEFKTYKGLDAIEYIKENLSKFGIFGSIEEEESEHLDNYYLLILTCKKSKIDGVENNEETRSVYYGTLNEEKNAISLFDITTRKEIKFSLKDYNEEEKHIDL